MLKNNRAFIFCPPNRLLEILFHAVCNYDSNGEKGGNVALNNK